MAELTNAEAALLGLLSEKPMYPYQMEQEVQYRDMRFWTELSMSSIYKLLRKLEKDKLVERTNRISAGNRLQKIYSISKQGMACLQAKIVGVLSCAEHIRWQLDIGIYNCNLVSAYQVREALRHYRADVLNKINNLKKLYAFLKNSRCPLYRCAVAMRRIVLLKAEVTWVDSYLQEFNRAASSRRKNK